jgi:hypothetical protein
MSNVPRLSKFASLSRHEQALLVGTTALLAASRLLLATVGLARTVPVVDRLERLVPPFRRTASPEDIAWAVAMGSTLLPLELSCLERAVVGNAVLNGHGITADLRLGVDTSGAEFQAHAWIVRDGEVLIGVLPDLDRFTPLPRTEFSE